MVLSFDNHTITVKTSSILPPSYMDKLRALLGISRPSSPIPTERQESNVVGSTYSTHVTTSTQDLSTFRIHDSGPSNIPMANPGPKCFRISNVPSTWSKDDLLNSLKEIDPSLERISSNEYQLSLFPACHGSSKTAILNFETCTKYFQKLKTDDFNYQRTSDGSFLVIDSHFHDLTPLSSPEGKIVADVVAVTGLAGHAFNSWRSPDTNSMWLKDFLPKDFKNIRVMAYGYDSSLTGPKRGDARMTDYRRSLLEQLGNARVSANSRPIIFLGHSLGGIVILQTLVESKRNPHYKSILDSTYGIFLFGTPHQGLRTNELESMVDVDSGGQRKNLMMQLKQGSEYLETQREDLISIWAGFEGKKLLSFYETMKTLPTRMLNSEDFEGDGEEVQIVERFSALTFLQSEHRVPVNTTHTGIVKFATSTDSTYQTVVTHITECIGVCSQIQQEISQKQANSDPDELQKRFARLPRPNTSFRCEERDHRIE
ncbi:hypothetical protein BDD12DRAFT_884762 [Trichophaea hybrida]|nr:hypothetical protein BDD12DRAFT_884762 [Trichophaea hybrida]